MKKIVKVFIGTALMLVAVSCKSPEASSIEFEIREGRIFIPVEVSGENYHFIYDTGASGYGRIDSALVEEYSQIHVVGKESNFDGVNYSTINQVEVKTISAGNVTHNNISMLSRNYNRRNDSIAIPGIIGKEFFSDYLITIDYPNQRIHLKDGELSSDDEHVIDYTDEMFVDIEIGGNTYTAKIDTGSSLALHIPLKLKNQITITDLKKQGTGRRANTVFDLYSGHVQEPIRLAGNQINDAKFLFSNQANIINIGMGILKDFKVSLDMDNELVRLERPLTMPQ